MARGRGNRISFRIPERKPKSRSGVGNIVSNRRVFPTDGRLMRAKKALPLPPERRTSILDNRGKVISRKTWVIGPGKKDEIILRWKQTHPKREKLSGIAAELSRLDRRTRLSPGEEERRRKLLVELGVTLGRNNVVTVTRTCGIPRNRLRIKPRGK